MLYVRVKINPILNITHMSSERGDTLTLYLGAARTFLLGLLLLLFGLGDRDLRLIGDRDLLRGGGGDLCLSRLSSLRSL